VEMRALVRQLRGKHTVIVSSHILSEISETCDRILVIKDGEIVASGTEAELTSRMTEGVRVRLTVRSPGASRTEAAEKAQRVLSGLASVSTVERTEPVEPGDDLASFNVVATSDVRSGMVKGAVEAGLDVLELSRHEHELEAVFLRLAGANKQKEEAAS